LQQENDMIGVESETKQIGIELNHDSIASSDPPRSSSESKNTIEYNLNVDTSCLVHPPFIFSNDMYC
jgi:hypothetical protein